MNILILGRRGLGKTTLAECRAEQLNPHAVIAFDPGDRFRNFITRTSSLKRVKEVMEDDWWEYVGVQGKRVPKPIRLAYVPPTPPGKETEAAWDEFASVLWHYTGEHNGAASYALIVDETHELQKPQYINPRLAQFLRRAPTREREDNNPVDIIQTTHRLQDVNGLTFDLSDEVYIFLMYGTRSLEIIEAQWGAEVAERVSSLRTPKQGGRDVVRIDTETGGYDVITDCNSWFVDIRTAPAKPESADVETVATAEGQEPWYSS